METTHYFSDSNVHPLAMFKSKMVFFNTGYLNFARQAENVQTLSLPKFSATSKPRKLGEALSMTYLCVFKYTRGEKKIHTLSKKYYEIGVIFPKLQNIKVTFRCKV